MNKLRAEPEAFLRSEPLLVERRDAVLVVSIDDPPWNRMSLALMDALEKLVAAVAHDDGIRAVVLTGAADRNFSVGMNLEKLPRGIQEKGGLDGLFDRRAHVPSAIEAMEEPSVATLSGIDDAGAPRR